MGITVRRARLSEHNSILKVARTSPYTSGFGNRLYSGPENYAKGWIVVAKDGRKTVGGASIRHATRKPQTTVYDIFTAPAEKRSGVARKMLEFILLESPWDRVVLNVDIRNEEALDFYERVGFIESGGGNWKSGQEYVTLEVRTDGLK